MKTGSALIRDTVGPAGSISEGALTCAYSAGEDVDPLEELLEAWPEASKGHGKRHRAAVQDKKLREILRKAMKKNPAASLLTRGGRVKPDEKQKKASGQMHEIRQAMRNCGAGRAKISGM